MTKREISNIDLKTKLTSEYLDNGDYERILDVNLLNDLMLVKTDFDGKVIPSTD